VEERAETLTVGDVAGGSSYGGYNNSGYTSNYGSRTSEPVSGAGGMNSSAPVASNEPASVEPAADFTAQNRTNMWDSIRTENEDDLDVPPTLRERLRNKNKE